MGQSDQNINFLKVSGLSAQIACWSTGKMPGMPDGQSAPAHTHKHTPVCGSGCRGGDGLEKRPCLEEQDSHPSSPSLSHRGAQTHHLHAPEREGKSERRRKSERTRWDAFSDAFSASVQHIYIFYETPILTTPLTSNQK